MKPAAFDYIRAETLAEVHATLATEGEQARVIAGGQTLVPMLSMRLARPNVVLDIMRLSELGGIWLERDSIEHRKAVHPDQPIMTYVEFFRERQQARYAVGKGRFRGCC